MNTFYHGCNSIAEAINIVNFTECKANDNGKGFYCSEDIEVARRYGNYVIAVWTDQNACVTRPINDSPMLTISEQMELGMESVFSTDQIAQQLFVDANLVMLQRGDEIIQGVL
jgi:hypothetical protein